MQLACESAESIQVPGMVDALVTSDTHKLVSTFHWHLEDSLSNNFSLGFHQDGEEVLLLTDVRHPCLALVDRDFAALELT